MVRAESIPAAYKYAKYEVDKETLRADLEGGEIVSGARLGERTENLSKFTTSPKKALNSVAIQISLF